MLWAGSYKEVLFSLHGSGIVLCIALSQKRHKRVVSLEDAWKLFKTTVTEAQTECVPQGRKSTAKSKRMPESLTMPVKEAMSSMLILI